MNNKSELGQFYTTNAKYIIGNLISDLPSENITIVDPFAGECDLLKLITKRIGDDVQVISCDIEPKLEETELRDSLLNPLDYSGMWVVTNPPYLARNKANDKIIFDRWNVNDLYKASIKSIMGCEGGILVVPLNFFCDEQDDDVRTDFLSKYTISGLNIFEERVFDDTDYTICSFSFIKGGSEKTELRPRFYPCKGDGNNSEGKYVIEKKYNYRIGGKNLFGRLSNHQSKVKISRLVENELVAGFISHIFLRAIDTGTSEGKLKLEWREEPYYGKISDRAFATLIFDIPLDKEQEKEIIEHFNCIVEKDRSRFHSLFLTNYRNATKSYARKRISFKLAFKYVSYILKTELGIGTKKSKYIKGKFMENKINKIKHDVCLSDSANDALNDICEVLKRHGTYSDDQKASCCFDDHISIIADWANKKITVDLNETNEGSFRVFEYSCDSDVIHFLPGKWLERVQEKIQEAPTANEYVDDYNLFGFGLPGQRGWPAQEWLNEYSVSSGKLFKRLERSERANIIKSEELYDFHKISSEQFQKVSRLMNKLSESSISQEEMKELTELIEMVKRF